MLFEAIWMVQRGREVVMYRELPPARPHRVDT